MHPPSFFYLIFFIFVFNVVLLVLLYVLKGYIYVLCGPSFGFFIRNYLSFIYPRQILITGQYRYWQRPIYNYIWSANIGYLYWQKSISFVISVNWQNSFLHKIMKMIGFFWNLSTKNRIVKEHILDGQYGYTMEKSNINQDIYLHLRTIIHSCIWNIFWLVSLIKLLYSK